MTGNNSTPGTVGIVTVTFGSGAVLPDFIRSVDSQTYIPVMIFAVDNASKDNTVEQLNAWSHPRLVVIANKDNVGVAAGNNQGIRAALKAGCDYVLLLNNDVFFGPTLVAELVDGLATYSCDMTTPLIYYADLPNVIWAAGGGFKEKFAWLNYHIGDKEVDSGQYSKSTVITYAPTCCLLAKREVFDRVGFMDERYFVYFDDTDFMIRALRCGVVTYLVGNAKMWHKVSSLTGALSPFAQRYSARNRAFYIRKHLGPWAALTYTLLYRSFYLSRFLLRKDDLAALMRKQRAWSEGLGIIK
jgi:GT2 family glycosyltransferase